MGWLRRSPLSTAALLVYLFASVAGALHHHGHDSESGAGDAVKTNLKCGTGSLTADDDGHSCAICTAFHQAKTPPIYSFWFASLTPTRKAVIFTSALRPLPIPFFANARAPPTI